MTALPKNDSPRERFRRFAKSGTWLYPIINGFPDNLLQITTDLFSAGASLVQLRIKERGGSQLIDAASLFASAPRRRDQFAVINDDPVLAAAACADGVHIGSADMNIVKARDVSGEGAIIGVTVRGPEEAADAESSGADYVSVGPIYSSRTKMPVPVPFGPKMVRHVADAVEIPVVVIGGITREKTEELVRAGACGLAVIDAVFNSRDPIGVTREWAQSLLIRRTH